MRDDTDPRAAPTADESMDANTEVCGPPDRETDDGDGSSDGDVDSYTGDRLMRMLDNMVAHGRRKRELVRAGHSEGRDYVVYDAVASAAKPTVGVTVDPLSVRLSRDDVSTAPTVLIRSRRRRNLSMPRWAAFGAAGTLVLVVLWSLWGAADERAKRGRSSAVTLAQSSTAPAAADLAVRLVPPPTSVAVIETAPTVSRPDQVAAHSSVPRGSGASSRHESATAIPAEAKPVTSGAPGIRQALARPSVPPPTAPQDVGAPSDPGPLLNLRDSY